jgi:adenosine kinase
LQQIIVSGSIAFDYLMSFAGQFVDHILAESLDHLSVSFLVEDLHKRRGGTAANIAYNLALLGEKPVLVGSVGEDFSEYGEDLSRMGIDLRSVKRIKGQYTASFFGTADEKGNQLAFFYPGAMRRENAVHLLDIPPDNDSLVIVSPNDPGTMMMHTRECKKAGIRFIFDPGQQTASLQGDDLIEGMTGALCLIVNKYEMDMICSKTGYKEEAFLEKVDTLIVTLGKQGARIRNADAHMTIPAAKPDTIKDPTGVGDAFRGGLVKGICMGLPWETAARMGSLAAVYVLETDGPQSHAYDWDDFTKRYGQAFGDSSELQSNT